MMGEVERLRRAIARHRRDTACCEPCASGQVADALSKRKATADGRLWASIERDPAARSNEEDTRG